MQAKFLQLLELVLGLMLPESERNNAEAVQKVVPRLGMVYAICAQQRCHYLSLVQRMMGVILTDGLCDVRVSLLSNMISLSHTYT